MDQITNLRGLCSLTHYSYRTASVADSSCQRSAFTLITYEISLDRTDENLGRHADRHVVRVVSHPDRDAALALKEPTLHNVRLDDNTVKRPRINRDALVSQNFDWQGIRLPIIKMTSPFFRRSRLRVLT